MTGTEEIFEDVLVSFSKLIVNNLRIVNSETRWPGGNQDNSEERLKIADLKVNMLREMRETFEDLMTDNYRKPMNLDEYRNILVQEVKSGK